MPQSVPNSHSGNAPRSWHVNSSVAAVYTACVRSTTPHTLPRHVATGSRVSTRVLLRIPFGSSCRRAAAKRTVGYRCANRARSSRSSAGCAGISALAQCGTAPKRAATPASAIATYSLNLAVIEARPSSSASGRYMMIPTQLVMASGSNAAAGDMAEALREHQRCSMGAGAPMPMASMSPSSCSMYCRSAPLGFCRVPAGKAVSRTHCWPPQSKPSSESEGPHRYPELRRQKSASASFMRLTQSRSRAPLLSSASRSSENVICATSCGLTSLFPSKKSF
mmetsp:Transcript_18685/g.56486  ORF Transcript_18685/g.56486 Transcript_18685/m.56486 type:complete len:279 (+) Transcript_18685:582-1418(+)